MANQNTEHRDREQNAKAAAGDDFDQDLERDNRRNSGGEAGGSTMSELAGGGQGGDATAPMSASDDRTDQGEYAQHARRGQAESPREETLNQPERHREGHSGGARDS